MRRELDRRPLVGIAVGLGVGLAAQVAALPLLALVLLASIRPGVRLVVLLAAGVGFLLAPHPGVALDHRAEVSGTAVVATVPRIYPDSIAFVLDCGDRRYLATAAGRPDLGMGDRLRFRGAARPPSEGSRILYAQRGLAGRLRVTRWARLERGPWIYGIADVWRRSYLRFAEENLSKDRAAIASALAFNLDSLMDEGQTEAFRRGGTLHIVSVSGAHVAMVAAVLLWFLRWPPLPRGAQMALLGLVLGFYAVASGLGAPIVRSAVMGLALGVPYLWRREGDFPSALALAAILVLLFQPRALRDVGFQLSFVTVGAMGLYGGTSPLRQGFVASFASVPLVAYHFGTVPLLAVPANLLIATFVGVATVGGIAAHFLWLVWPLPANAAMAGIIGPCVGFVEDASRWVGAPEWAVVRMPEIPGWAVAAFYAGLAALWRPGKRAGR